MTLAIHIPATLYPTIELVDQDWVQALKELDSGETPVLTGGLGGRGCRGGDLGGGVGRVKLLKRVEDTEDTFRIEVLIGWPRDFLVEVDGCAETFASARS